MRLRLVSALALLACTAALAGCAHHRRAGAASAQAVLEARSGSAVHGTVTFLPVAGGLRVVADVSGLTPGGLHAIHIHEKGDCSAADGSSAGGHYNPDGHPHGGPGDAQRHAGDLGNLFADATGHASYDRVFPDLTIDGAHHPIAGLSVIVHKGEDDLRTQPTGNAGGRIACGVITPR